MPRRLHVVLAAGCLLLLAMPATAGLGDLLKEVGRRVIQDPDSVRRGIRLGKATAKAFEQITPSQEYYIGRAVGARILARYRPKADHKVNRYLNLVGAAVSQSSDLPATFGGYHFMLLDSNEVNAMACPGGLILVTRGLVSLCRNEGELAAVLAHEVGHVVHRHGIRAIKQSRVLEMLKLAAAEGARQAGGGRFQAMANVMEQSVGDVVKTILEKGYSRDQEREADRTAALILARLGYNPKSLVQMLEALKRRQRPGAGGFFKTHPPAGERAKEVGPYLPDVKPLAAPPARQKRFRQALSHLQGRGR